MNAEVKKIEENQTASSPKSSVTVKTPAVPAPAGPVQVDKHGYGNGRRQKEGWECGENVAGTLQPQGGWADAKPKKGSVVQKW